MAKSSKKKQRRDGKSNSSKNKSIKMVLPSPQPSSTKNGRNKKRNNTFGCTNSDTAFRNQLEMDGSRSINEMQQDGNCLFRSLSDQIYGDYGRNHEKVRADICDYIEANKEMFEGFVTIDDENADADENCSSFAEYVERMRDDGEWGGNLELVAAANLYGRNITVFSAVGAFSINCAGESVSGKNLQLSYHDNDHYNSVVSDENDKMAVEEKKKKETLLPSRKVGVIHDSLNGSKNKLTPNKNGLCTCGSGLKCKKCCQKSVKKGATSTTKRRVGVDENSETDDKDSTLSGNFKVLHI